MTRRTRNVKADPMALARVNGAYAQSVGDDATMLAAFMATFHPGYGRGQPAKRKRKGGAK